MYRFVYHEIPGEYVYEGGSVIVNYESSLLPKF